MTPAQFEKMVTFFMVLLSLMSTFGFLFVISELQEIRRQLAELENRGKQP